MPKAATPKAKRKQPPRKITPQREAFARLVVRGYSQAEAYRRTFAVSQKTKPATIWNEASKLVADPLVAARIEVLKADAAARAGVTLETMLSEMEFNHERAVDAGDNGAANTASRDRARLAGLLKEDPANRTMAVTININSEDKGLL